MAYEEIMIRIR